MTKFPEEPTPEQLCDAWVGGNLIHRDEHEAAIAAAELRGAKRAAQHILGVHLAANAIIVANIRAKIDA